MKKEPPSFAEPLMFDRRPPACGEIAEARRPARALAARRSIDATPAYWFCMFAASALGTNLGDFWVDGLSLDRGTSFASLAGIAVLAAWTERKLGSRSEIPYWIAVVALRAAATNVGDFLTHDLAFSYLTVTAIIGVTALVAACFTRSAGTGRGVAAIDGRYWLAMLIAGMFGTVGGDLMSLTAGLYAAAGILCVVTVAAVAVRYRFAPASVVAYWGVMLVERCAGTPVGDSLASSGALGLGLPVAMVCTGGVLIEALLVRAWAARRRRT